MSRKRGSSWREERNKTEGRSKNVQKNVREGSVVVNLCTCVLEVVEASWERFHILLCTDW